MNELKNIVKTIWKENKDRISDNFHVNLNINQTPKIDYANIYDKLFRDIRFDVKNVFEMGTNKYALNMLIWRKYFPNANIYGIDRGNWDEIYKWENYERIYFKNINQIEKDNVKNFLGENKFDIIIDDCYHTGEYEQKCFKWYFEYIKPKGYYIIESVGMSFKRNQGDGSILMFREYEKNKNIISKYINNEESKYLESQIKNMYCFPYHKELMNVDLNEIINYQKFKTFFLGVIEKNE